MLLKLIKYSFIFFCFFGLSQEVQFTATMSSTTCSGTLVQFDVLYIPSETSVTEFDFNEGFRTFGIKSSDRIALVSHGKMTHLAVDLQKNNPDRLLV